MSEGQVVPRAMTASAKVRVMPVLIAFAVVFLALMLLVAALAPWIARMNLPRRT